MAKKWTFTSESVTEGHPDKMADQVSDGVLDAILAEDPTGRVACETLLTTGLVVVAGEITTTAYVDIPKLVRETVKGIGYDDAKKGFDGNTCGVIVSIDEQSSDIAMGVDKAHEDKKWIRLNQEVASCLIESGEASQELKSLRPEDQVVFSSGLKIVASELEQKRIVALKQYMELPDKAKSDSSLLKPPKYFSAELIKLWDKLHKETHLISEASIAKSRFDAGVQSAQLDVEANFMDFARQRLVGMTNLNWSNSK